MNTFIDHDNGIRPAITMVVIAAMTMALCCAVLYPLVRYLWRLFLLGGQKAMVYDKKLGNIS